MSASEFYQCSPRRKLLYMLLEFILSSSTFNLHTSAFSGVLYDSVPCSCSPTLTPGLLTAPFLKNSLALYAEETAKGPRAEKRGCDDAIQWLEIHLGASRQGDD